MNTFGRICDLIDRHFKHKSRRDTRIKMYKTITVPILLYGSELQVLDKREDNHIQAVEMKFLRAMKGYKAVSYTHLDVYKRQQLDFLLLLHFGFEL